MRVLLIHERYRERGGEDAAFDAEAALLAAHGVEVIPHLEDNGRIAGSGSAGMALRAVWSPPSYRATRDAIRAAQPDLVHVHNTFPLLSPSVYDAARACGVPVVQTLHNYRLLCPNALLLRDAAPCQLCLPRTVKWPGVLHRCYRGSAAASVAVAAVAGVHRAFGTWRRKVDLFLALTSFAAGRFAEGGLPRERLAVSGVAVPDPGPAAADGPRAGALCVGRLSPEKGLDVLIEAWRDIDAPLDIIGDGPMMAALTRQAPPQVRFLGRQPAAAVSEAMARASLLVFPSLCYENFPLVVVEAMAHGLPVLASSGGAVEEMVEEGATGVFARPGVPQDWSRKAAALLADPDRLRVLGAGARRAYEARYAPDRVFEQRMGLYRRVLGGSPAPAAIPIEETAL